MALLINLTDCLLKPRNCLAGKIIKAPNSWQNKRKKVLMKWKML